MPGGTNTRTRRRADRSAEAWDDASDASPSGEDFALGVGRPPAEAASRVDAAISHVVAKKLKSMQAGKMGYSTSQVGDLVAEAVA